MLHAEDSHLCVSWESSHSRLDNCTGNCILVLCTLRKLSVKTGPTRLAPSSSLVTGDCQSLVAGVDGVDKQLINVIAVLPKRFLRAFGQSIGVEGRRTGAFKAVLDGHVCLSTARLANHLKLISAPHAAVITEETMFAQRIAAMLHSIAPWVHAHHHSYPLPSLIVASHSNQPILFVNGHL